MAPRRLLLFLLLAPALVLLQIPLLHDAANGRFPFLQPFYGPPQSLPWEKNYSAIRLWGCHRTETPFVFVHLNKAGGGLVRRRIAFSAFNVTRDPEEWLRPDFEINTSYYPVRKQVPRADGQGSVEVMERAVLCNSVFPQYTPMGQRAFEGSSICMATTPMGQALACPAHFNFKTSPRHCQKDLNRMDSANIVYLGHNGIGAELHFLPVPYLRRWWKQYYADFEGPNQSDGAGNNNTTKIAELWQNLDGLHQWCGKVKRGIGAPVDCESLRNQVDPLAKQTVFRKWKRHHSALNGKSTQSMTPVDRGHAWSDTYAALPVLRVTMIREPFSLLASRYAWFKLHKRGVDCDDIEFATGYRYFSRSAPSRHAPPPHSVYAGMKPKNDKLFDMDRNTFPGWARRWALDVIFRLCGSDCSVRHLSQESTLEELTAQAEANLRHAFAVVGILEHGEEEFYEMIHQRVEYLENITSNVTIARMPFFSNLTDHHSDSDGEAQWCKKSFSEKSYQAEMIKLSAEVRAMIHLYKVALEVNKFQREELNRCSRVEAKE